MKWGVYRASDESWLIDTCAGMTWSHDVNEAVWYDSIKEAKEAVKAADTNPDWYVYLRLK